MSKITVMIQMEEVTLAALREVAQRDRLDLNDLITDALKRDLYRRTRAKTSERTDERLVAPLRALLADDIAYASDWEDLIARISAKGYDLRASGGGVALFEHGSSTRIAKGSDLGASYGRLMRRFGSPMPGHGHRHLADKLLGPAYPPERASAQGQRKPPSGGTSVRKASPR